jgi:predicted GNAT family N-acyltransferase
MASPFISMQSPVGKGVFSYDWADPKCSADVPQIFVDAMDVRKEVFIDEQHCSMENEIDSDDPRSWHWVVYASVASFKTSEDGRRDSETSSIPVGTIRLVPPHHVDHSTDGNHSDPAETHEGAPTEPVIKLGRLATLKPYRGLGLSKLLVSAALNWASEHSEEILPPISGSEREALGHKGEAWNGLVLAHAQTAVEKVWAKYGFTRDVNMGEWEEEGIMHIGMIKRIPVKAELKPLKQSE